MATSKNIDDGFLDYISTTFKSNLTAGGVLFGTILYPLYILTHTVATYIILSVVLVVITTFLIDKIRLFVISRNILKVTDVSTSSENTIESTNEEIEKEIALTNKPTQVLSNNQIDDDIFIEDEEEIEKKSEAKSILGLENNRSFSDLEKVANNENNLNKSDLFEFPTNTINTTNINEPSKPSIIVHDEDTFSINNSKNVIDLSASNNIISESNNDNNNDKQIEDERKQAALDYIRITQGKFKETNSIKNAPKVEQKQEEVKEETVKLESKLTNLSSYIAQTSENNDRINQISSITDKLNSLANNLNSNSNDIYDENLTKENFRPISERPHNITLPSFKDINGFSPRKASAVYTGEVNDNIVESKGPRIVQESMIEPPKPKPTKPTYTKPPKYIKPSPELLEKYSSQIESDEQILQEKANLIVSTLENFKIGTKVINAVKGPTFTRYELQMAPGIAVSSVTPKIPDLSMALESSSSVRVQIPIPGKNAFGIEVPNKKRVFIGLREIVESPTFINSKSPLTIALGKDISNEPKIACLDELVHTLVAGSTGSGKSVCLHTILISLLYKTGPEDLKLLLVDPKMVEFPLYNNLPHMLIPEAITDCDKAIMALNWLVEEMDRRYVRLMQAKVRNIDGYNQCPEVLSGVLPKMYYIVMVFDEVGDYMAQRKKEIEEKVVRLAAKSRACGIHLILTTQRPTTDVITGTIKTNLPSRIAFAVNSYIDSKTILESAGAESLLGKGDMLLSPKGSNDLTRIQCANVKDAELQAVIQFIKDNNPAEFDEEIYDQMFNKKDGFDPTGNVDDAFDPMLKDCLRYFIKTKKCSASSLQGNFSIGYPKANRIVQQMEKANFISPADEHNGRRTIYITAQEFEERFGEGIDE